jgi:hypothetical protein
MEVQGLASSSRVVRLIMSRVTWYLVLTEYTVIVKRQHLYYKWPPSQQVSTSQPWSQKDPQLKRTNNVSRRVCLLTSTGQEFSPSWESSFDSSTPEISSQSLYAVKSTSSWWSIDKYLPTLESILPINIDQKPNSFDDSSSYSSNTVTSFNPMVSTGVRSLFNFSSNYLLLIYGTCVIQEQSCINYTLKRASVLRIQKRLFAQAGAIQANLPIRTYFSRDLITIGQAFRELNLCHLGKSDSREQYSFIQNLI